MSNEIFNSNVISYDDRNNVGATRKYKDLLERFSALTQEWNGFKRIIDNPKASILFKASSGFHTYIVPPNVDKIHVEVCGAKGANSNGGLAGGKGGKVECDLAVTPGQKLYIVAGAIPSNNQLASYNASDIRTDKTGITNTASLQSRLVVAGGGGSSGSGGDFSGVGGAGGGLVGQKGADNGAAIGYKHGCYGGSGGNTTTRTPGISRDNVAITRGQFGLGGNSDTGAPARYRQCGAGGAGYYGGGGATGAGYHSHDTESWAAGGGGGSSYADANLCSNVVYTQGANSGAGYVIISKVHSSSGNISASYRDTKYLTSSQTQNGYVKTSISLETDKIHTLGNENNIRRSLNEAYETIYDVLKYNEKITKPGCYLLGEETTESTTAKKYSDSVFKNEPYRLFDIKKHNTSWCTTKDDYIVTYDINTKRKLELDTNNTNNIYIPYVYNNDIIYIKGQMKNGLNDVYKLINNQYVKMSQQGNYITPVKKTILNTSVPNTYTLSSNLGGEIEIILVGAGGGGGGGSWKDDWKTCGAGGGSGGYIKANTITDNSEIKIEVGRGGAGGSLRKKHGGDGQKGTDTKLYINNQLILTAGGGYGGGGSLKKNNYPPYPGLGKGGSNSISTETPYIINVINNKKGNNGQNNSRWPGTNAGGASVYNESTHGAGGSAPARSTGGNGKNGYAKIMITENSYFSYNNQVYVPYEGYLSTSIILRKNYDYISDRLDVLEDMFKSYRNKNWFDSNGVCQTQCQLKYQTP